tara:strand:+ start:391 stop:831 length:441 start_codon:yes stop_codon:yes gene_type:complete
MQKKILIINGPNINLIGSREKNIYGETSIEEIKTECELHGAKYYNFEIEFRQSNSEGDIINWLQEVEKKFDGLIINPAAYTHTSIAILDSLKTITKPKIEIHLSNIHSREDYRKKSITAEAADGLISGFGKNSYLLGIDAINQIIK